MRTSGGSSETLMLFVPVGVSLAVGMLFYGGPAGLLAAVDTLVREIVHVTASTLQSLF